MKIAWFTPFSNKSAIGKVGKEICEALVKHCNVDIWTNDSDDVIKTNVNVINFSKDTDVNKLNKYTHIFYNMGNFAGNHKDIYHMLLKKSGYVVIHDQKMGGFWWEYLLHPEGGGDATQNYLNYKNLFQKYYGIVADGLFLGENGNCQSKRCEDPNEFAVLQPILNNAMGVFTHAHFFKEIIEDIYNGPVGISYLPISIGEYHSCNDAKIKSIIKQARLSGKKIIVSNGTVQQSKQVDKAVNVLLNNPVLAQNICYILIGQYDEAYAESLIKYSNVELKNTLFVLGYQSYEVMNYTIKHADMCVNMRYPNTEVCSLSLLEQMSYGKPVLVLNSGIYGEIPDENVVRIHYDNIEKEIEDTLCKLITDESFFHETGLLAKKFVTENCTVECYVGKIMEFIEASEMKNKLSQLQNHVFKLIANELSFLGINETNSLVTCENIINDLQTIYGKPPVRQNSKTIGLWADFSYQSPDILRDELLRLTSHLVTNLVTEHNVHIEIWCYSRDYEEIKICFQSILNNAVCKNYIKIIHEKNWEFIFTPSIEIQALVESLTGEAFCLENIARNCTKAEVFIPLNLHSDSIIGVGKSLVVNVPNMVVLSCDGETHAKNRNYKFNQLNIRYNLLNFARYGATMVSNSKTVLEEKTLKYVHELQESKARYVYLPADIPLDIKSTLLTEQEVRSKFSINGRYLFYPAQGQSHNSIATLLHSFNELKDEYGDLKLVLMGDSKNMSKVDALTIEHSLQKRVVLINSLSKEELYSVYQYASMVPVVATFSDDFPIQAQEALYMKVPVLLSNLSVVTERIEFCGFSESECGLFLFEPTDNIALANGIKMVLENSDLYLSKQNIFAEALLKYTWKDAASKYYKILFAEDIT